jgi:hypothetical protein
VADGTDGLRGDGGGVGRMGLVARRWSLYDSDLRQWIFVRFWLVRRCGGPSVFSVQFGKTRPSRRHYSARSARRCFRRAAGNDRPAACSTQTCRRCINGARHWCIETPAKSSSLQDATGPEPDGRSQPRGPRYPELRAARPPPLFRSLHDVWVLARKTPATACPVRRRLFLARKAPATACPGRRRLGGDGAPTLQFGLGHLCR